MWNTFFWLIIASVVVASFTEVFKVKTLKDQTTKKQGIILGIFLSILLTPVVYFGFNLQGEYITMLLYFAIIYIIQKQLDMKAIRPIIKKIVQKKLNNI